MPRGTAMATNRSIVREVAQFAEPRQTVMVAKAPTSPIMQALMVAKIGVIRFTRASRTASTSAGGSGISIQFSGGGVELKGAFGREAICPPHGPSAHICSDDQLRRLHREAREGRP